MHEKSVKLKKNIQGLVQRGRETSEDSLTPKKVFFLETQYKWK